MSRRLQQFRVEDRGASLVEFTLMAPLLLLMGGGIVEFGNALYGYHVINTGVHDAARYLARLDDPASQYGAAKTLAVTGEVTGSTGRLSWWTTDAVTPSLRSVPNPINMATGERTYRGADPITIVRVSTTATYPGIGFLSLLGLGSTLSFTVFHEERVIHE